MPITIPVSINGMRIRQFTDGSFGIPREDRVVEAQLDLNYIRVINELRWFEKIEHNDIALLSDSFRDRPVYIIGKGASLDNIDANYFDGKSPVICINDSVHQIEKLGIKNPIYCIQQDTELKDSCKPMQATMLISHHARYFYTDYQNTFAYIPEEYGLNRGSLTVIIAIEIMKRFGANKFILLCFDACTQKRVAYAKCIGYPNNKFRKDPDRFLRHRQVIDNHLAGYSVMWVTP